MANNYLLFSETLELVNEKEIDWVVKELNRLEEKRDDNDNPMLDFQWSLGKGEIWFYTEEAGEPEKVGLFVQEFLKEFYPDETFTLTWATTCSRPRVGEFSGGGMLVTSQKLYFIEAGDWIRQKRESIKKRNSSWWWRLRSWYKKKKKT